MIRSDRRTASILFQAANVFFLFVPGSVLLFLGQVDGLVLPGSIVKSIFPFTAFPFEKFFVADVVQRSFGLHRTLAQFDDLSPYPQQFFVLALILFFLTFLSVGSQIATDA